MAWASWVVMVVHDACLLALVLGSLQRLLLAWRPRKAPPQLPALTHFPDVTVQLPLFNEPTVAARLLDAACGLDWPRERLHVQVLDDSTDETVVLVSARATHWRQRGVDISVVRGRRQGFKAGALQRGLACTSAEYLCILDADFVPPPDFLRRLMPAFDDGKVGFVQARWGHLNEGHSLLTRVQALMLDGHFLVEQWGRAARGAWFNFNGTAGIWRRRALEEAGGWRADTLTEDLDLSYRAQLAGWRAVFLPNVLAPAEIPAQMAAFKSQQHRWTKGSAQTALLLLPRVWRSTFPLRHKLHATAHLLQNLSYVAMLALCLLAPLAAPASHALGITHPSTWNVALWLVGVGALTLFYAAAAERAHGSPAVALTRLPALMMLGAGICVLNTRAVLGALGGTQTPFVRTPKQGLGAHAPAGAAWDVHSVVETLLGAWLWTGAVWHAALGWWVTVPVQLLLGAGLCWVGGSSLRQAWRSRKVAHASARKNSGAGQDASSHVTPAPAARQTV